MLVVQIPILIRHATLIVMLLYFTKIVPAPADTDTDLKQSNEYILLEILH